MPILDSDLHDVIIAGAGPVGLFLAGELGLAGCSVLVLEKAIEPHTPLKRMPFGLRGLSVPTVESFDRRGLLDALRARGLPAGPPWMEKQRRPAGHFAGIQFFYDRVDTARWSYRLARPIGTMAAEMASIEAVLAERAVALGVEIRRNCGVDGLLADERSVAVNAGGNVFRGRWLVGCDGGRSIVRKAGGFRFAGTDPEFTGYSVEVTLANTAVLQPGRHYTPAGMYTFAPPGTIAMVDFDGGACHRVELTRDHVEAVLRRISGADLSVTALHLATTWTDRAFQAAEYRKGRVLLAGDAAHVHSPLGGQGLNLGLGDAINLGWKLAATIRGDAAEGLIDSYARERQPIGAAVLDWSRAQVALMRPSPSSRALESIMRDLIETDDGATYFAERVWAAGMRYDLGSGHLLVGRSVPDFALLGGDRVNAQLRSGRGLLIDFAADPALRALVQQWGTKLDYVGGESDEGLGLSAALVRPDGVVAWASATPLDAGAARDAVTQWFGAPSARR